MSKKIENKDLFAKDAVTATIKDFEHLIKIVNESKDVFKDLLEQSIKLSKTKPLTGLDGLEDVQDGIKGAEDAIEGLTKAEKEQIKLEQKLAGLKTQQIKNNEVLKQQIVAARKELREEAKQRAGITGEYAKQSKLLNDLRKRYKDLALTEGEASKEAKDLLVQITELDTTLKDLDRRLGQNGREVGSYKKQLQQLENQLADVQSGVDKTKKALRATGIITFLNLLTNSFGGSEKGAVLFQKAITTVASSVALLVTKLVELFEKTDNPFDLYSNAKEVFKGFTDELEETVKKNLELVDASEDLRKSQLKSQKKLADFKKGYEALRIVAEDTSKPLLEQEKAAGKAVSALLKMNALEIKLAKKRLDIAEKNLKNNKSTVAFQEAAAQAYLEYIDVQINAANELEDIQRTRTEALRDELEQELDFLFDVSDARKTANEKILKDERRPTAERVAIIEEAEKDVNDSFDNVIAKVVEYQEKVNDNNKKIGKSTTDTTNLSIKLREALTAKTTEEVNKQVKALELDEIVKKRVLELVKQLTAAESDFAESKKETDKILEKDADLNRQIELQNKRLNALKNTSVDLDEEQRKANENLIDSEIQLLQAQLETLADGSTEKLEVQKKLNDLIIERTRGQIKKIKEIEEKAQQEEERKKQKELEKERKKQKELAEIRQLGIDSIKSFSQKQLETTTNNIDKEITALENRQDTLRELAARGQEDAQNNLALEQKRRAELEAKREQAIRRQQNIELGLSVLETYSNKVAAGDENALGSTIRDTSLLLSFINSLPTFWEGSDRVGDDIAPFMAGPDGVLARVDKDEMVMNNSQAKMIRASGMSRDEVAHMAYLSKRNSQASSSSDNTLVVKELREVKNAIENIPSHDFRYDDVANAVVNIIKRKGKVEKQIKKNSAFF